MSFDAHKNFAYSTVATAPSPAASGTTLTVQTGDGALFPAAPFNVTVWPAGQSPRAGNAEVVRVTSKGTGDNWTIARTQEGSSARSIVVGDQIAATITAKTLTDVENGLSPRYIYDARSSNTILGSLDAGHAIYASAAFTQTLDAAATLGAGWWCVIRNDTSDGTTVLTVDPNGAETIDGLTTIKMYSGETRLILCDGSNFHSQLLEGGFASFTADGTFVVPAGITHVVIECIGGGGGGGGGRGGAAGSVRQGGSGGGGGARIRTDFAASDLGNPGDSISVGIGAGGSAGAGGTSADGTIGGNGGNTTFGALLTGYGGGGGFQGTSNTAQNRSGGGGGGYGEAGQAGQAAASSRGGGNPAAGASGAGGQGAGSANDGTIKTADSGGGSGGITFTLGSGAGVVGGTSFLSGAGGGGGGGLDTGNTERAGGAGGAAGTSSTAGGGGGTAGAVNGGNGGNGASSTTATKAGGGGGGGGSQDSGTGGIGGNGGTPGGAGGGGGGGTTSGGGGGAGGRGQCRVWFK